MKGIHSILVFALSSTALFVAISCGEVETVSLQQNTVRFASQVPVDNEKVSRGTPVTNARQETFTTLGVYAYYTGTSEWNGGSGFTPNYMSNRLVTRTFTDHQSSDWTYSPAIYWPDENQKITFLAYSPYNSSTSGLDIPIVTTGIPDMYYTVPEKIAEQVDLMIAHPYPDATRSIEVVPLRMAHALTLVSFSAAVKNTNVAGNVKVFKITVSGVKGYGETTMTVPVVWGNQSVDATYVASVENGALSDAALSTTMTLLTTSTGYLLLMPQPFEAPDETSKKGLITVEYGSQDGNSSFFTQEFPLYYTATAWEAGKAVNYQILFDADQVGITATLAPWVSKEFNGGSNSNGLLPWD